MNSREFDALMKRKFFFTPSFGIYGGVSGLYDLGPTGCSIKNNLIQMWRKHFIQPDSIYEIDTTSVTPYQVLNVSGHVEKFTDMMVCDKTSGKEYRADHLIEDFLKKHSIIEDIDFTNPLEVYEAIQKFQITAPETSGELDFPKECNLMFKTKIGPTGKSSAFLRPETAQGIFMNFNKLLELNGQRLPFAGATIGRAFRNEISQKPLVRGLEFTLCEIEHFFDPLDSSHRKIRNVEKLKVLLHTRDGQIKNITIREALDEKIITNETLAYYLGRTHLFAEKIGLKTFRFRQHKKNEMAHYASDCWDLEIFTSYGWLECAGLADRSCYDLKVHSEATSTPLQVFVPYETPVKVQKLVVNFDRSSIGKTYRGYSKFIFDYLSRLTDKEIIVFRDELNESRNVVIYDEQGNDFMLSPDMVQVATKETTENGRYFIPNVVEPSFGVERLLYSLWEQSFYIREESSDEEKISRGVMGLQVKLAPFICTVLPLMIKKELTDFSLKVTDKLSEAEIYFTEDNSGASIGKRYARSDEIGIPFAITIDYQSLEDSTITLRERDSMKQTRVHINDICETLRNLTK
jgi:glycyl-tRNA synthetase